MDMARSDAFRRRIGRLTSILDAAYVADACSQPSAKSESSTRRCRTRLPAADFLQEILATNRTATLPPRGKQFRVYLPPVTYETNCRVFYWSKLRYVTTELLTVHGRNERNICQADLLPGLGSCATMA